MRFFIIAFAALFLVAPLVGGQEFDYLREALQRNPEVAAAYESWVAASKRGTQLRALDEPSFSYSEFISSVQTRTGPQERIFSLSQNLPWPGVLKLKGEVADAEAHAAWYRYEIARRKVLESVGLALIEYAYLKDATDRSAENLGLIQQLKPVVDEKVRAGGSLSSQLRLDVELATASQDLESLRDQRPALSAQLMSILGREPDGNPLPWPAMAAQTPALMPLEHVRSQLLQHHPQLGLADAMVETAQRKEDLTGKNGKPAFTVGANAIDIGNGGETASSVTVGVKLPIRRNKYQAEREEAAAMIKAAGSSAEAVRQQLLAEAVRQHSTQQEAMRRLRNYDEELIPAAEQALELTKEEFRTDKASLTDLIESERVLLDLHLMRSRALADAQKAAWKIRALTEPSPSSGK